MCKRVLCFLAAIVSMLSLTACWDHVEISEMLVIAGIGLDADVSGQTYYATVEIINVEADGDKNIAAEIVEGKGDTIPGAIENAMLMAGGVMFGNHCKVIVLGESLARSGIGTVIETVLRSPDFNKTVDILIAKESDAKDIFTKKTVVNDVISYELAKILRKNEKTRKNTISTGAYMLHESLSGRYASSVIPTVHVERNRDEDVLSVDGCAVLTGDRLQCFLDGDQCKLLHIVTRNSGEIMMTMRGGNPLDTPVNVKIINSRVSLHPRMNGNELRMDVAVYAKATLEDAVLTGYDMTSRESGEFLSERISRELSADIHALIETVQSVCAADIFGFALEYQDAYRSEWMYLQKDWPARFKNMQVSVDCDTQVTGSGLIGNYIPDTQNDANALP